MLGQNMFAKAPPSGYQGNYFAQIQTNQNQQKFDQLLQLMQQQEQQVSEYNQNIKQKEDQLYNLDKQSQQLQRELIQKDKSRNEHNQIHYKNYLPSFNVLQNEQIEDNQQPLFNSKYQQYNQGMQPEIQQEIQMSQNPRKNTPLNTRPQSIQNNDKLYKMQQQIEEQNEFIKQLTNLIGIKKQNNDNKDDSLTILMNEKEDQSKFKILNEIKELKQRIEDYDQQKLKQPQQMYPIIPQQLQQYNNQMIPFQNQYGMYPQQMIPPPQFGYPPPIQQQQIDDEESDDDNFNNEILMKLLAEQNQKNKRNNRQKNMKNSQQSHQRKQNKKNIPQEQTQNDSQDV